MRKIKIIAGVMLGFTVMSALAGNEDWTGTYELKTSGGQMQTVTHKPTHVSFMFFTVGRCLSLSKGARLNGMEIMQDTELCTHSNINNFTMEVAKLGTIIKKDIKLGISYKDE